MSSADQSNDQVNSTSTEESSTTEALVENKVEATKYTIRKQVWTHFEKNELVSFPRRLRGRIPNFHAASQAADKLAELDVFKNADCLKVNSDKPQETVRILALEKGKKLFVSAPRKKKVILLEVVPASSESSELEKAVSRRGMLECGKPIALGTDIKIDLIVVGSVAVSREGRRIGKGVGYEDLEFAILVETGAITKDTVIATTVHDSQVFETLPQDLFKDHDFPVDIIITPTEVIHVTNKLPRPSGVIWNILSQRKMNLMVVSKVLMEKEILQGKDCRLKEEDTDSETEGNRRGLYQVRRCVRYPKNRNSTSLAAGETGEPEKSKDKKKQTRRFNRFFKGGADGNETNGESELKKQKICRRFSRNAPIQFSLRIGNITSNVRVRDLKNALAERNVKPTYITWRGHKGFAFIHFAELKKEPESSDSIDYIVSSLRDMKIGNGDEEVTLLIEPTKPTTRIESTGIAAV